MSTLLCARRAGEIRPPRRRKPREISRAILTENHFLIFAKCVHGHIRTIKSGKNFRRFYDAFRHEIDIQQGAQTSGLPVETGEFGADMKVELLNDGPVTLWMDTKEMRH